MSNDKDQREPQLTSVASVLVALGSSDELVQWHGARAAGNGKVTEAIPSLMDLLEHSAEDLGDTNVRVIAAWALAQFGDDITPKVLEMTMSRNPLARAGAVDVLGLLARREFVPVLREMLKDSSLEVRLWASLGLAKIGQPAVPVLEEALKTADKEDQVLIGDALAKIASNRFLVK